MKPAAEIVMTALLAAGMTACQYSPLKDAELRKPLGNRSYQGPGVTVTFLGNTTLVITDGKTTLLIDGFVSRPGRLETFGRKICSDPGVVREQLYDPADGVKHVDAVLLGHAHHDHALDIVEVAGLYQTAKIFGSNSVRQILAGAGLESRLTTVPGRGGVYSGEKFSLGKFEVEFVPSDHLRAVLPPQRAIEGHIKEPLVLPASYKDFKCGDVFALVIRHPEGNMAVTTSAGAKPDMFGDQKVDVFFLGVGFLSKLKPDEQDFYWKHTVEATEAGVIVPVHWDDFTRGLNEGLRPPPPLLEDSREQMAIVKAKAGRKPVRILDLRESLVIQGREVHVPVKYPK